MTQEKVPSQETTEEFAFRLRMAVEGNPHAPTHGAQRWLMEKVRKETGLEVSPNTMNKWYRGLSRPREDSIRKLARTLDVDEIWLAMGRKPTSGKKVDPAAYDASNATLLLAGLLGLRGVRFSFAGPDEQGVSLWANVNGKRVGLTVVDSTLANGVRSFIVPEPVGSNRVLAVTLDGEEHEGSFTGSIFDLTDFPRENFGGFSVIKCEERKDGRLKIEGQRSLVAPVADPKDLLIA